MDPGTWAATGWGIGGGVAAELLTLYGFRTLTDKPKYLKTAYYWVTTAAMIVVGGATVYGYVASGSNVSIIEAAQLGAAAPLVLRNFAERAPAVDPGNVN